MTLEDLRLAKLKPIDLISEILFDGYFPWQLRIKRSFYHNLLAWFSEGYWDRQRINYCFNSQEKAEKLLI